MLDKIVLVFTISCHLFIINKGACGLQDEIQTIDSFSYLVDMHNNPSNVKRNIIISDLFIFDKITRLERRNFLAPTIMADL